MSLRDIADAVMLTAELIGSPFRNDAVAMAFVDELDGIPEPAVLSALKRCRRECRGRLTVRDVLERTEAADGRPGPEEAWALCPRTEAESVVWTQEIAEAWGVALPVMESGDEVGARMAFRETYARLVSEARESGRPVQWSPSLGHDLGMRESALKLAVERNRLTQDQAAMLAPPQQIEAAGKALLSAARLPALPVPDDLPPKPEPAAARKRLAAIREEIGGNTVLVQTGKAPSPRKSADDIENEKRRVTRLLAEMEKERHQAGGQ